MRCTSCGGIGKELPGIGFSLREPIFRRERDAPYVTGRFEFECNLEKLADRARTLNPSDASPHDAMLLAFFGVRHFDLHPHIFEDVMLGLIAAAVAVEDER